MLGKLLGARYKVIQVLGAGGFGQTYTVEDTQRPGNPICVLKHLVFDSRNSTILNQVRRLFQTEAEALEQLGNHDQIPRLLAYFEDDQQFYLVQEFIEGRSLSEELEPGQPWDESQVIGLLTELLQILEYVHGQGVIHRDIKPDNIIRRQADGKLVLIDFGAVKAIGNQAAEVTGQPQYSVPIYTSGYASSEQCLGKPRFSSDIYAVGMIAIQALTGLRPSQFPHDPDTSEVIWHDQAKISKRLAAIIEKMVRYHFSQRYQSTTEVLQALHQQFHPATTLGFTSSEVKPPPNHPTRSPVWKWAVGAGAIALVVLSAGLLVRNPFSPPDSILSSPSPSPTPAVKLPISQGETVLTPGSVDPIKQQAVDQISAGRDDQAVQSLEMARQKKRADPETLIYLNNARIGHANAYTIAVVVPLGSLPGSSWEILRGVAQAQDQINRAQGIKGLPLRVAIANDDNQASTAHQLALSLVNNPTVLGVVGHGSSDTTLAAAQTYQAGELTVIAPISSATKLSGMGSYIFRTTPSDQFTARKLAEYMLTRLKKKKAVVFFNAASAYSKSLKEEFKNALFYQAGSKLLAEFDLARPGFSASDDVDASIQQGADVILLASDSETADRALQVIQINRRRLSLLSGESLYTPKTLQLGAENASGMAIALPTLVNPKSHFAQQAEQLWGMPVSWRTALAYDATEALIAGLQAEPSRRGVQRTLSQPKFSIPGATGQVSFLPNGDREGAASLVIVAPITSGKQKGTYEFKPLPF